MAEARPKTRFWCPEALMRRIRERGPSAPDAIRDALTRYFNIIDAQMPSLRRAFTDSELALMVYMCWLPSWQQGKARMMTLHGQVAMADYEVFRNHGVDRELLLGKLTMLDAAQQAALTDAIERYLPAYGVDGRSVQKDEVLR